MWATVRISGVLHATASGAFAAPAARSPTGRKGHYITLVTDDRARRDTSRPDGHCDQQRHHRAGSDCPGIRQYQFVQKAPDLIELRLAGISALAADEEAHLSAWVQAKFGAPFRVVFACFDEIPRTSAGKFEDFICEIEC